ncbi:hypothetical protein AMTR_s00178p00042020 [Amborella trichopoda]|uniref:Uncharacterized protein n=1 Tax=Amborella trichopoda TaxID=13333 RepID=W1PRE3_AMBTC|nr:hypothetical protein AMTR_s00178p00042020 [Amborella trichopoda]
MVGSFNSRTLATLLPSNQLIRPGRLARSTGKPSQNAHQSSSRHHRVMEPQNERPTCPVVSTSLY